MCATRVAILNEFDRAEQSFIAFTDLCSQARHRDAVLFSLFFQPWEVCVVASTSLVFVGSGAHGVYVSLFREAYGAFSQSSPQSFKVKSCRMHQSPAFYGPKGCKHGEGGGLCFTVSRCAASWTQCVNAAGGCGENQ